jgi:tRNA(Ile2) C34 agmatinyltransferase TiaS
MKEFKTIQEAAKFVKLKPVQVYETYIKQSILRDTYIIEEVSITKNAGNAVCLKCNRIFLSPDKKRIRRCARCKTLEGNDFTPLAFKSIYDGRQTLRSENVKVI